MEKGVREFRTTMVEDGRIPCFLKAEIINIVNLFKVGQKKKIMVNVTNTFIAI